MVQVQNAPVSDKAIREKNFNANAIRDILAKADADITQAELKTLLLAIARYLWAHRAKIKTLFPIKEA